MFFIIGGEDKKKDAALITGGFKAKNYSFFNYGQYYLLYLGM